jgi:hypothetical protein
MILTWPPASKKPASPVWNQPSASFAWRVASGILVVLAEQARRADQQLALRAEAQLDAVHRRPHGVGAHFAVGLDADEHRGLGRAVRAASG